MRAVLLALACAALAAPHASALHLNESVFTIDHARSSGHVYHFGCPARASGCGAPSLWLDANGEPGLQTVRAGQTMPDVPLLS